MTRNTVDVSGVYLGIDTHKHTHRVAVIDTLGRQLGDQEFPATSAGYLALLKFVLDFGPLIRAGIEGTASYGAGLTAYFRTQSVMVREVIRPSRQERRHGKSDPIDAYAAARAVAAGDDLPIPKLLGGRIDGIRALLRVRRSAVRAHGTAMRQVKSLLITADPSLREKYEPLKDADLVEKLTRLHPKIDEPAKMALHRLAKRMKHLEEETALADAELAYMVDDIAPALVRAKHLGPVTAAQLLVTAGENHERIRSKAAFAALCGLSPIPAASGKTTGHRLNRGGDRQANSALHTICLVRMSCDPRTRTYVEKKRAEGRSTAEIMRCLKRYIANEVFTLITNPPEVPNIEDLRPLRQQRNLTLKAAAEHLGTTEIKVSQIERADRRDDEFAKIYREYLLTA